MIIGVVRSQEPIIPLTIHGSHGRRIETEAVVDTGYTGWLNLPPRLITMLGLQWYSFGRGIMADGTISLYDVYLAKVVWDGRMRRVRVNELDAPPLVGMSLLKGFELKINVRSRGQVTIKRLV